MDTASLLALTLVAVLVRLVGRRLVQRVTVLEYERAIRFSRGRFDRVLGPGL